MVLLFIGIGIAHCANSISFSRYSLVKKDSSGLYPRERYAQPGVRDIVPEYSARLSGIRG